MERYQERLENVRGVRIHSYGAEKDISPNYAYFPVIVDQEIYGIDRNTLFERLKENNIFARKYFYPLITDFDCYKGCFDTAATPVAKEIAGKVLTLPLYADLQLNVVDHICDIIAEGAMIG